MGSRLAMTTGYSHLFPDRGRKAVDRLSATCGTPLWLTGTETEAQAQEC